MAPLCSASSSSKEPNSSDRVIISHLNKSRLRPLGTSQALVSNLWLLLRLRTLQTCRFQLNLTNLRSLRRPEHRLPIMLRWRLKPKFNAAKTLLAQPLQKEVWDWQKSHLQMVVILAKLTMLWSTIIREESNSNGNVHQTRNSRQRIRTTFIISTVRIPGARQVSSTTPVRRWVASSTRQQRSKLAVL